MQSQLIRDDQLEVDQLQADIRTVYSDYPHALSGLAKGGKLESLPESYQPEMIEVYHEDPYKSVLTVFCGDVVYQDPAFFIDSKLMLLEIEGIARYIRLNNRVDLNVIGGCELPDILHNPISAATTLLEMVTA